MGFAAGFSGVWVWVGNSVPPKNPYLWHGFWVTHTVTHHMCDLPLGHQRRRWQQLDGNGEPSTLTLTTLTLATTTTFHSGTPQDEQHDRKRVMGRMTRAGEGPSRPPPIVWYVSFIFLIFRRSGEGYAPPRCVFAVLTRRGGAYTPPRCVFAVLTRRGGAYTPPHRVVPLSTWRGGACPLPIVSLSHFRRVKEGYTPPHCIFAISTR